MKRATTIACLISVLAVAAASAQVAPVWNHYLWNGLAWNPAFAGSQELVNVSTYYRRQWVGIDQGPSTALVSVHGPLANARMALGGQLVHDRIGPIRRTGLEGSYAWRTPVGPGMLALGLHGGIALEQAAFSDLDAAGDGDPAFQVNDPGAWDWATGVGAFYSDRRLLFGVSAMDLAGDPAFYAGGGMMIRPLESWGLRPAAFVRMSESLPVLADLSLHVLVLDAVWVGGTWRTNNAGAFQVEYRLEQESAFGANEWGLGYGYQLAAPDVRALAGGTHELFFTFRFPPRPDPRNRSPVLLMRARGFLILALCTLVGAACAQPAQVGQRAERERARGDRLYALDHLAGAIKFYGRFLQRQYDAEVCARMADCHRQRGEYEDAEHWYAQAVASDALDPVHYRRYAEVLRSNGKGEQARGWFERYDRFAADPGPWAEGYALEARFRAQAPEYRIAPVDLNGPASEIAPAFFGEHLIFASDRSADDGRISPRSGRSYYDLYLVRSVDGQSFLPAGRVRGAINSPFHDVGFAWDAGTGTVWFTRTASRGGKRLRDAKGAVRPAIYQARVRGQKVRGVERFAYAKRAFTTAHPALSPDGNRLYFSSDRPGGHGGLDLWYSDRGPLGWEEPVNLGAGVNTAGDEVFPTCAGPDRLYFSSDGHPGLGGLDLFTVDRSAGSWDEVENLGPPVNSPRDDFGIVVRNNQGYFCSDRPGGAGRDDVYAFERIRVEVEVEVRDATTDLPIGTASVELVTADSANRIRSTDSRGTVRFGLAPGKTFYLIVGKAGFERQVISATLNRENFRIRLDPQVAEAPPVEPASSWRVRVGRFRDPDLARLRELEAVGPWYEEPVEGLRAFYVGPFADRSGAETALDRIRAMGFPDAYVEAIR